MVAQVNTTDTILHFNWCPDTFHFNMNNSKISLPDVIQDVQGEENIARMWRSHYKDLFNCLKDTGDTKALCSKVEFSTDMIITPVEVKEAIKNLECNKSCGKDGIHAEHLKYSSCRVIQMLSMALTGFLICTWNLTS